MHYLAVTSLPELGVLLGAVFGAFGTILFGFYNYAKAREKDFSQSRDNQTTAFNKALDKLGAHLDHNSKAIEGLQGETRNMRKVHEKGYAEAEKRNGHLAEITIESRDSVIEAISHIKKQNIKKQVVETQTVEHQD